MTPSESKTLRPKSHPPSKEFWAAKIKHCDLSFKLKQTPEGLRF